MKPKILYSTYDDLWTGNISFSQITYDTVHGVHYCGWENDTSWSNWSMEASIINNNGTAKSSFNSYKRGNGYDTCMAASGAIKDTAYATGQAATELELGIDKEAKEYGFTVDIPSCTGKHKRKTYKNGILDENSTEDTGEDQSQIRVDNQKLGSNPNILSGRIELHDRKEGHDFIQIWKWNLKKVK